MTNTDTPSVVTVPVQSAWLSKINWTQAIQAAAMVLVLVTGGKVNLDPTQQAAIVVTIGVLGNALTVIFKTWFTGTVTPQSAAKA